MRHRARGNGPGVAVHDARGNGPGVAVHDARGNGPGVAVHDARSVKLWFDGRKENLQNCSDEWTMKKGVVQISICDRSAGGAQIGGVCVCVCVCACVSVCA